MILHGDSLDVLKTLDANSIDSVVTDPPYGLAFMGKRWDYDVPSVELWREVLRVLKPGGHLLSFGGTRTYHRMVVAIEDAGFEIRDQVMWLHGQGFPKSKNLGNGFGSALKPAVEPIVMARKPLEGTLEKNFAKWGTGALNVDASRIDSPDADPNAVQRSSKPRAMSPGGDARNVIQAEQSMYNPQGRWPANVLFDEDAASVLDEQSGVTRTGGNKRKDSGDVSAFGGGALSTQAQFVGDSGGASRFFYVAKASKRERNAGLEGMPLRKAGIKNDSGRGFSESDPHKEILAQNFHPTVKPVKLMEYLVRMITPPGGTCLDPFAGSGTTGVACKRLGFKFVGIERESDYCSIAEKRLEGA